MVTGHLHNSGRGNILRNFERLVRWLANTLAFFAGISLIMMMGQTVLDVLMSNFYGAPIEGNLEVISVYHMVLVVFLSLAFVELRHEHISADLFVRLMPKPLQRISYVFSNTVAIIFFAALTYQTALDALAAWRQNEIVMGSIYIIVWPAKLALPIGFSAILLALFLNIYKSLSDRDFKAEPDEPVQNNI